MLIDFHNHVLPGADDGAVDLEMSLAMLRTAVDQGITDVVNTIHYQHPKLNEFRITDEELRIKVRELQAEVDQAGIPVKLHPGAEVYYLPNLMELIDQPATLVGKGKYMLVEFQFHQLPEGYREIFFKLVMAGITPIIAHPERYKPIQRDYSLLRDLIEAGCVTQMDGGSLVGTLGSSSRQAAQDLLKSGMIHLIGSDAHDFKQRNFCLAETIDIGRQLIGDGIDIITGHNPRKLLAGEKLVLDLPVVRPEKVPVTLLSRIKQRFVR